MVTESRFRAAQLPAELAGHHEKHLAISARHVVKKSQQFLCGFRQMVLLGQSGCRGEPRIVEEELIRLNAEGSRKLLQGSQRRAGVSALHARNVRAKKSRAPFRCHPETSL